MLSQKFRAIVRPRECGMNWNSDDFDCLARHAPMSQICGPFGRGREIPLARLIDPQTMRFEIGRHGELRGSEFAFAFQMSNHLGREEMCIDDDVPRLTAQESEELAQIQSFS